MSSEEQKTAFCPSCERFIGPADVCPYCETDSAKPPIIRKMRVVSLLLAVLGLAFLYMAMLYRDRPMPRIGDISPTMNFAYIKISGRVERDPFVSKRKGQQEYVAITVNDGTGALQVTAFGKTARALLDQKLLPAAGDEVEAAGVLNVSADGKAKLRLQTVDQFRRVTAAALPGEGGTAAERKE